MLSHRQQVGNLGEDLAADFLKDKGYQIVERNYRKKWGEIDLIVTKSSGLILKKIEKYVFVEVKTLRRHGQGIFPEEEVTFWKQKRIIRAAKTFLAEKKISKNIPWQIDVVAIEIDSLSKEPIIRHLKNAVWE
ncbi:MAG TPA: YraN family protein [Candidatus Portnoybacteria bacterium]|nr:YraN family protein [Candidatus Portnoybacteria bacterium]